jgi:hypothetical protein
MRNCGATGEAGGKQQKSKDDKESPMDISHREPF